MSDFAVYSLAVGGGELALAPVPGTSGSYPCDLAVVQAWGPAIVLSMTTMSELEQFGAGQFGEDLLDAGIAWLHLPVPDFGVPRQLDWSKVRDSVFEHLSAGRRVLVHCKGGCGRSGMIVLRLMIAAGEDPDAALMRLRRARLCAVETLAQLEWARRG
ncbi:Cyclin-dependent kinase inhibitor 3 (CDKN3) [Yoonia maritima]|uniref:Cyclin-dependent kinase inhibitor 3 (CDKN3) n=1 Tax=Yoonia maritima TaxID=1435347 RepID=A0A2T0W021_9RHOB|nr:Cyclin-dependent kinase inhibitor 3 (CDKN3) [Yoonia maritima]